jgi:GNAT superfamily N-acetyltransferase
MRVSDDQAIEMAYYRDPLEIEALDQDAVVGDLSAGCEDEFDWRLFDRVRLTDHDHLVLAVQAGRVVGLLAAFDGRTGCEEFLLLDAAFVRPDARGARLMHRMMAALMLRIGGLGPAPTVIAACTGEPRRMDVMRGFGRRLSGAACHPPAGDAPVQLRAASLARRVAGALHPSVRYEVGTGVLRGALAARGLMRSAASGVSVLEEGGAGCLTSADQMLMLIDLRTESEEAIMDGARKIFRAR